MMQFVISEKPLRVREVLLKNYYAANTKCLTSLHPLFDLVTHTDARENLVLASKNRPVTSHWAMEKKLASSPAVFYPFHGKLSRATASKPIKRVLNQGGYGDKFSTIKKFLLAIFAIS